MLPPPLQSLQKPVIVFVRPDPEPNHRVALPRAKRSVVPADADRVDRFARVHLFQTKARVSRVALEPLVGVPRSLLDALRKPAVPPRSGRSSRISQPIGVQPLGLPFPVGRASLVGQRLQRAL